MLILLVYGFWGGHRRVECVRALVGSDDVWFSIYLVSALKIIKGGKDIISDDMSWVGIEFLVH